MRQQLSNFTYGILDYAAYPIGMLIVAPFVLGKLGVAQYGIWSVTASAANMGSVIASGFGDAATQRIAGRIASGREREVVSVVRAAMGIHLVLGFLIAIVICCLAPALADRLAMHDMSVYSTCVTCIRLAALLTAIRAVETVCISTQKAHQRYGTALQASIAARVLSLTAAAVLASGGQSVTSIMAVTAVLAAASVGVQAYRVQRLIGGHIKPDFERPISNDLLRFGAFTWLLAIANVVFSQADRLAGAASVGAAAIVSYALCAQLCQPVYGLTAAGLHFLFPYFAARRADQDGTAITKALLIAVGANLALVLIGAGSLLAAGNGLLRLLASDDLARASAPLLLSILAGSALLALSVTGSYAMVALGKVRTVALLNLAGCAAMVLLMTVLLAGHGVLVIAGARIVFAFIALCVYIPLLKELRRMNARIPFSAASEAVEEA